MDTDPTQQWRIPDELWEHIDYLLPERKKDPLGRGRPPADDRVCMDAIFYVLRTGCQWKALDATVFCPGSTAHDRFQEWERAGVFLELWKAGLMEYDALEGIDWTWLSMDGAMTKSPLSGEKMRAEPHGSRERRGQTLAAHRGRGCARGNRSRRGQPA